MLLTILTPTYNRRRYLSRLYESLCSQTDFGFQWLLIDDGSTDETDIWFSRLPPSKFRKEYHGKENGGKHTAVNYAHEFIKGELVIIVDSDDWLVAEAVAAIRENWKSLRNDRMICGMTFLRGTDQNTPLKGLRFPTDGEKSDSITRKVNQTRNCDSCEIIRTSVLKEFPFPEHMGEKFMGESYLWNLSGYKYKTVYFNKVLYVTEYLEGGLTKSGRGLRIRCPLGGMDNSKTYFNSSVCMRQRIKNSWLFICYGKFAGWKPEKIIAQSGQGPVIFIHYPFGCLLYRYWKKRFLQTGSSL